MIERVGELISADPKLTVAILVPFVTFGLNRWFTPSAKLFHSERHRFYYLIHEPLLDPEGNEISPTQNVSVASLSLANAGRVSANNVEITFNWKPQYFNVWPIRPYEEKLSPDGRYTILLESLAPKESFGLEMISVNCQLPELVNARSSQAESREKKMIPQVVLPAWQNHTILALFFLGFVSAIYLLLTLLDFALG